MKKYLALLSLGCALCCTFGLVACGEGGGKTSTDELLSAVETALNSDNYTLSYYTTSADSTYKAATFTWKVDVKNGRYFQSSSSEYAPISDQYGFTRENGKYFMYEYDSSWTKTDSLEAIFTATTNNLLSGLLGFQQADVESYLLTAAKENAGEFAYNKATGEYTATGLTIDSSESRRITITLENGKVTSIDLNGYKGGDLELHCTYSNFGTTDVALPEDVHMAASEWTDTINAFKELTTNFSFTMSTGSGSSERVVSAMQLDGTTCYDGDTYYIQKSETYYKYERDSSSYAHSYFHWAEITASEYNTAVTENCYEVVADIVAAAVPKLIEAYDDISGIGVYYHSNELELDGGIKLKDIAITVEDGIVTEVECVRVGDSDYNIHIFNIGTTEVVYPTPAFQTFVLKSIEDLNGYATDFIATLQTQIGKTIIFAEDGSLKGTCDLGFGILDNLDTNVSVTYSVYLSSGNSSFNGTAQFECIVNGTNSYVSLSGFYHAPTFNDSDAEISLTLELQGDEIDGIIQLIFALA